MAGGGLDGSCRRCSRCWLAAATVLERMISRRRAQVHRERETAAAAATNKSECVMCMTACNDSDSHGKWRESLGVEQLVHARWRCALAPCLRSACPCLCLCSARSLSTLCTLCLRCSSTCLSVLLFPVRRQDASPSYTATSFCRQPLNILPNSCALAMTSIGFPLEAASIIALPCIAADIPLPAMAAMSGA